VRNSHRKETMGENEAAIRYFSLFCRQGCCAGYKTKLLYLRQSILLRLSWPKGVVHTCERGSNHSGEGGRVRGNERHAGPFQARHARNPYSGQGWAGSRREAGGRNLNLFRTCLCSAPQATRVHRSVFAPSTSACHVRT
jgi:hypothetical protein